MSTKRAITKFGSENFVLPLGTGVGFGGGGGGGNGGEFIGEGGIITGV